MLFFHRLTKLIDFKIRINASKPRKIEDSIADLARGLLASALLTKGKLGRSFFEGLL